MNITTGKYTYSETSTYNFINHVFWDEENVITITTKDLNSGIELLRKEAIKYHEECIKNITTENN